MAILGVAYLGIYPTLQKKTLNKIMAIDAVLTVIALAVAGALFYGNGTSFTLIIFETNWVVFCLVTLMAFETPMFLGFAKRYGIKLWDDPDQDP